MTPEQESALHRSLSTLNANIDLLRGEMRRANAEVHSRLNVVVDRLDKHGRRIAAIEQKIEHAPDDRDVTGNYRVDVALLQAEQERIAEAERLRRSDSIWARRQMRLWLVGALGALAMAALTGAGGVIFWALTHK